MAFLRGFLAPAPLIGLVAADLLAVSAAVGGGWSWPAAIVFVIVYGGLSMAASGWLAARAPASFAVRRQKWVARKGETQPLVDALGLGFYMAFFLAWFAFLPLDVFRLHLLPEPPRWLEVLGLGGVIAGLAVVYTAVAQNRFAAPTIHEQAGQTVVSTGLYGVVRHPFYGGMLLVYLGAALWLGSYAGAIAASGFLIMTLARISIEERWLRAHLPDYPAYAQRVRSRLIPFVI